MISAGDYGNYPAEESSAAQKMSNQRLKDFIEKQNDYMIRKDSKLQNIGQDATKDCPFQPRINEHSRKLAENARSRSRSKSARSLGLGNQRLTLSQMGLHQDALLAAEPLLEARDQHQTERKKAGSHSRGPSQPKRSVVLAQIDRDRERGGRKSLENLKSVLYPRQQRQRGASHQAHASTGTQPNEQTVPRQSSPDVPLSNQQRLSKKPIRSGKAEGLAAKSNGPKKLNLKAYIS